MSSRNKVPVTFTFHRRGVHPPLFVAGSFTNPPWQALEMDASIDQHGDYIFTKQAMVDERSEIQYKFRHASGDWWALDPDADTATDDNGNVNSLLYSPTIKAAQEITMLQEIHATKIGDTPSSYSDAESSSSSQADANTRGTDTDRDTEDRDTPGLAKEQKGLRRLSFTPIEEVANTAAEVADSASYLDLDEDQSEADDDDIPLPMFSHECFVSSCSHQPEPQHDSLDYSTEDVDATNIDFDDPLLEHFPSDRDSIMATMRRVSTAIETDPTTVDPVSLSPIITAKSSVASNPSSTRGSFATDNTNTEHEQMEDLELQLASITTKESLQSIAEGDEPPNGDETRDTSIPVECIGPVEKRNPSLASWGSNNGDEGVSMSTALHQHGSKTNHIKTTDDETQPTIVRDETSTDNGHPIEEHESPVLGSSKSSEQEDQSNVQKPIDGERPPSPSSTYSIRDRQKGDWIRNLFRTMFVDWIGNLFCWLCSRSQNQV
ncbi:hypothetical protein GGR55DRAFT_685946 [Xylaria sp. FL0064]|nr:hypothetical protein GGR55DRAFT_685946 [Xylaria sp. FL0064]